MRPFCVVLFLMLTTACESPKDSPTTANNSAGIAHSEKTETSIDNKLELDQSFKDYWYAGLAEISSYNLIQSRYGEPRTGDAVLIYVTEPFDPIALIKADQSKPNNRSVFKLNATRNFETGIYPYHIMSSTFLPLDYSQNALKVATSIQEWCGHTYMQLDRQEGFYNVSLHSYFQQEGNKEFKVSQAILENQIPLQLRLDPSSLPTGTIDIIPGTEYLRLMHQPLQIEKAIAQLSRTSNTYTYQITYESGRSLSYAVEASFPYKILEWQETFTTRNGVATTIATLKKTLRTAYWNKNSNQDSILRDSLDL